MRAAPGASAALLLLAAALVVWIRLLPLALHGVPEPLAPLFRYEDAGGRQHVHLGDYDSYAWLRAARNLLRTGSACDALVDGVCRDTYTLAPLGLPMPHPRSLHTAAIAAVQRVATTLDPQFPLAASAYLVPVLVGALGVLPAFAIVADLAGVAGGFVAALAVGLHPLFLRRSLGSDNDVWNVVLPLFVAWIILTALRTRRTAVCLGLAALAGIVTGLHAMTWRGWSFACTVMLVGLGAIALLGALRPLARNRGWRAWPWPPPGGTAIVAAMYALATTVATVGLAGDDWLLRLPRRLLGLQATPGSGAAPGQGLQWPSALADVSELIEPSLSGIAAQSNGYALFFVAWIGLALLLLPRRDWRPGHFVVLLGATILYRLLLPWNGLDRAVLIAALLVPLVAALVVDAHDGGLDPADCAGAALIATWFVAALAISYEGIRYVMLLAAPLGLATGVAAGRLFDAVDAYLRRRLPAHAARRRGLMAAVLVALAAAPVAGGYRVADGYLPSIDRAWADTFTQLRDTAPSDAIINAWWDYGHWAKYFAERRVAADGATLLSHAPNWIARAELATDEAEAVGILRMLDCGSDAEPYPEGRRGAYGMLLGAGIDARAAYALIERIAPLDRAGADQALSEAGLTATARRDVLAASHCDAPPAYLVLTTQQARLNGWWQLGAWRPGPDGDAPPAHSPPRPGLATADWVDCALGDDGTRRCAIAAAQIGAVSATAVTYRDGEPASLRVHVAAADGRETAVAPDLLLLAAAGALTTSGADPGGGGGIGVVLDADGHRVLVGNTFGVASLFTRLAFLDGAGTTRFRKVDDRSGRLGRVTTWAIDW